MKAIYIQDWMKNIQMKH